MSNRAPLPGQINYNKLSPASREVLAEIARITAGWTALEVAQQFNMQAPRFRHVPPPKNAAVGFTSGWVNARMRTLRDEMVASVDPSD